LWKIFRKKLQEKISTYNYLFVKKNFTNIEIVFAQADKFIGKNVKLAILLATLGRNTSAILLTQFVEHCKQRNLPTLCIVVTPFHFEGTALEKAKKTIEQLQTQTTIICFHNEDLLKNAPDEPLISAFERIVKKILPQNKLNLYDYPYSRRHSRLNILENGSSGKSLLPLRLSRRLS
jgi:hypothetical protein